MADTLNIPDDLTLSPEERAILSDLNRQFDNSRAVQERTMARYGLPALANFEKDSALFQATATANTLNKFRAVKAATSANAAARAAGVGGGGGGGGAGARVSNPLAARLPATTQSTNPQRNTIGGIMQLLPALLGRDGFNQLQRDGVIKFVRDAFGGVSAQPGENYQRWAQDNMYETEDGNIAFKGEDGLLRIVDPNTGELIENVGRNYTFDRNGDLTFDSTVEQYQGVNLFEGLNPADYAPPPPPPPPPPDTVDTSGEGGYDWFDSPG